MAGSLEPQQITATDWYYEEGGHMLFVHEVREPDGRWIRTDTIKIPWKRIEASLKRVRAGKRRAVKK